MRIMLTGHRPGAKMNESAVVPALMDVIRANHPCTVISGGADGADRYWARAAYKLKVPYEVWVPGGYYEHYSLTGSWTAELLWNAEHVNHIGGMGCEFDVRNNFIRNVEMIETADKHVVCSHKHPTELIKQKRGGTARSVAWTGDETDPWRVLVRWAGLVDLATWCLPDDLEAIPGGSGLPDNETSDR